MSTATETASFRPSQTTTTNRPVEERSERYQYLVPYKMLKIAFRLVFCGLVLNSIIAAFAGQYLYAHVQANGPTASSSFEVSFWLSGAYVVGLSVTFVGFALCLSAPRWNEKRIAVLAASCPLLVFLAPYIDGHVKSWINYALNISSTELQIIVISSAIGILANLLFLTFCKQVAQNIGSYHLEMITQETIMAFLISIVIMTLFIVSVSALSAKSSSITLAFNTLAAIALLIASVFFTVKQLWMLRVGIQEFSA